MPISDEFPLTLVHVLSNRISRSYYSEVEAKFGVSVAEWRVLLTVAHEPGITAAEITSYWAMEKMAVNRAIRRLVGDGYMDRARNPEDGRSYRLSLTGKGRELYEKVLPAAGDRYRELISALSKDEREAWLASLRKMIARADELS